MNHRNQYSQERRTTLAYTALSALLGAAILGYHPYAEDGGLYLAEIKHLLNPALYPHGTGFVTGHLRIAGFSQGMAALVRWTGWSLPWVAFLLHAASLFALLAGVSQIAARCYTGIYARLGAVAVVALSLSIPVAGTSLMLMDPYLTARGLSTPLSVLALAALLEFRASPPSRPIRWRWLAWSLIAFTLAAAVHPLMAAYAIAGAAMLLCLLSPNRTVQLGGSALLVLFILGAAAILQTCAPPETPEYHRVAATRAYWFLAHWQWFEWLGLLAPLAILERIASSRHRSPTERALARMAVLAGTTGLLLSILFVREAAPVHAIARMQPLRSLTLVYLVLLIVLGAALGDRILRHAAPRWIAAAAVLGTAMFFGQRATYPGSSHLELPWRPPANDWERAFLWIKQNTPADALFALDPNYVRLPGEDAQGFRAIAERSVLPDYAKDGGAASIRPELTPAWVQGQALQANLSTESDPERLAKLRGTGVSWLVLPSDSATAFPCPYRNATAKVCSLPQ